MSEREKVLAKSGGKCWYCGCELKKGWHVDHLKPLFRTHERSKSYVGSDDFDNKVPSCAPCNLFKATFSVEDFRAEIQEQVSRSRKYNVNFRTAERFGLIQETLKPVIFWFEANK